MGWNNAWFSKRENLALFTFKYGFRVEIFRFTLLINLGGSDQLFYITNRVYRW